MRDLLHDIRYGIRVLTRSPGFACVAVLSLALGIGANTIIFTIINAVFLAPIPVKDMSSLAMVFTTDSKQANNPLGNLMQLSYPNYEDFRDQNDVFQGLTAFSFGGGTLAGEEGPEQVQGFLVTGNYFEVLGVDAVLGRTFLPEEDKTPGTHMVMVLSHALWERRFGADPDIIGTNLKLNGSLFTVVGVAPKNFRGTIQGFPTDIWTPMMTYQQILPADFRTWPESRRALLMSVFGRLKEGVSVSQADAAIKTIATRLEQEYPDVNESRSATVTRFTPLFNPAQEDQLSMIGLLMMCIVGIVLLIACVNVANLLLARASVREKEIGVRLALGAGRRRLIRQLLTESMILALIGGALGFIFAFWGRDLLWQVRPPFIPDDSVDLTIDRTVLLYTIGLSLFTGFVFGLFPSLQSTKANLTDTLHAGGRGGASGRRHQRIRAGLVVAEISLAVVTLICAGLFVRSMQAAQEINPGFETERLASMFLNPAGVGYSEAQTDQIYRDVIEKATTIGGVASAAVSSDPPLGGGLMRSVIPEGEESAENRGILTLNTTISPGYFQTMGIPLLRGRDFTEFDRGDAPAVAIVNMATQKRFWPDEDPIGKRFNFITEEFKIEVVGVVQDTLLALGQPAQATVYLPYTQRFAGAINLIIRTQGDPTAQLGEVQDAIRAIDSDLPATNVRTIGQTLDQALWAPRFGAALLGVFGSLALILAMVGIFGVMSYSVNQRTREIGIRIAMGAQGRSILSLVVRRGMILSVLGLAIGLLLALAASRALASMLYEISPIDPVTFVGISGLLCLAALLACYLPARRATKVDPIVALRQE